MGLYYYGLELFSAQRNRYPPPDEAYLEEADNVEQIKWVGGIQEVTV